MGESGRRNLLAALGLHFLSVAAIILSRTLIDLIFLSTYPRHWLPYLFMGQTAVVLALAFGARPLVSSSSRVVSAGVLLTFAGSLVAARLLLAAGLAAVPFGVCLWLAAVSTMLGVISWGVVGDVFDVREFKRVAKWINAAGTVGALVFGALVPLLVRVVSPESLLYVLGGAIVGSMGCLVALRPLPPSASEARASKTKTSPLRYPLFRRLAGAVGLLTLVDTLGDYALKSELARAFDKRGIGTFMGPFYAIASGLTLLVQFVATNPLLSHFGVTGLIGVLPLYAALAGVALIALPGLWPAVLLRMGQNVAGYSVNNIGREIASRPLPSAIRRSGKLYLKGAATPIGSGLGALLLFIAASAVGLRGVGVAIVIFAALWFVGVLRVKPAYEQALEEAVGMGRLGAELDEADAATLAAGRVVAEKGLESADADVVLFSLELLRELGSGALPEGVARLLASEIPEVRAAAAWACESFVARQTVPLLLERLRVEQQPAVLWKLLEVLAHVGAEQAVEQVRHWTQSPVAEVRAGAVLVLLEAGDLDGLATAATALKQMARDPDPAMRRGAATAMGALRAGRVDSELRQLVADADDEVAVAAIRAAERRAASGLVDVLVTRLGHGGPSHYAGRALVRLGEAALPALEARIAGHSS
ncbi:MAG: HEAT repeat domain-containing protein, partial [Myxococcales bacterium]|nr:HEAT repeat domain-containing protein [Myxococcales bacterium]